MMKALFKYLSLLLCSGLIIPFYYYHIPGKNITVNANIKKIERHYKSAKKRFSVIDDVAANLFPVIKKLR